MNTSLKQSTALVLSGLTWMWFGILSANYVALYESPLYDSMGQVVSGTDSVLKVSTFIYLLALAGLALFSGLAFRKADVAVFHKEPGALPVLRFATVGVIVSLVSLALYAIFAFLSSFNAARSTQVLDQALGVYLPIVLAAAACVFGILSVTVYKKSEVALAIVSPEQKRAKREAALAFVYPILGTTVALLLGLFIYSIGLGTQVWAWVFILAIVGGSNAAGSVFAARTKAASLKPVVVVPKVSGGAALNLNFVLVSVFLVVVTIMSFSFGIGAISELTNYSSYNSQSVRAITFEWFINSLLPAIMILALVDVTAYIAVRIRSIVSSK